MTDEADITELRQRVTLIEDDNQGRAHCLSPYPAQGDGKRDGVT